MRNTFFLFLYLASQLTLFAGQPPVMASYTGNKLKFVENKGQWHQKILYRAELDAGFIYLLENGIFYDLYESSKVSALLHHNHTGEGDKESLDTIIHHHGVWVEFLNTSDQVTTEGFNPHPEKINYFIGNDPSKWGTNIKAYDGVYYHNVYPNIDLKIEMSGPSFKYEFVVHPGGQQNDIKMKFDGQEEVKINDGYLEVVTPLTTFKELPPYSYQLINGKKKQVRSEYVLNGKILSFKVKKVKKGFDLVIDPQLIFSTYSGSTADNWGNTATVDKDGNLYTGGTIFPTTTGTSGSSQPNGFPFTTGAFQTSFQGGHTDIGIIKFDSSGTFAYYATYIGGNNADIPTSIVTNQAGELYILGITGSSNFPGTSTGAFTSFKGGGFYAPVGGYAFTAGSDIVVAKLSANGDAILNATYMGGSENDGVNLLDLDPITVGGLNDNYNDLDDVFSIGFNYGDQLRGDIILDENENVYVASTTQSNDFPYTNGFQSSFGGIADGIAFKLNSGLDQLLWSTFIGGSQVESGMAINIDTLGNLYVVGGTKSTTDFPVTDTIAGYDANTNTEAYITKISSDGTTHLGSVKLGTSGYDQAYFIQLDSAQNIYILGQNIFGEYPITPGVYGNAMGGVFVHKVKNTLDSSFFSTTIGDLNNHSTVLPNISPTAFLVNDCGNLFISGWGGATNENFRISPSQIERRETRNMPLVFNSFKTTTDGSDFYLMVLEKDAQSLIYSTYFGSNSSAEHVDGGTSRFDKRGIVYQSVCAGCLRCPTCGPDQGFPLSPIGAGGTYPQPNLSGNCNNGVFKFDLASLEAEIEAPPGCLPLEVMFQNNTFGGVDYFWDFGDGTDTLVFSTAPITHVYDTTGEFTVRMIATDRATCIGKDTAEIIIFVNGKKPNTAFYDTTCINTPIMLRADTNDVNGKNTYKWFPSTFLDRDDIQNPTSTPTTSIEYLVTITDSLGCVQVDTFRLSVHDLEPAISPNILGSCSGFPKVEFKNNTNDIKPAIWNWDFGDGKGSTERSPEHQYDTYDTITVSVVVTDKYCSANAQYGFRLKDGEIPNTITPNGDGINECFVMPRTENSGNWELTIHNRWGDLVYKNETYTGQWCAKDISDGTYYYLVISPTGDRCKGWVQIIR